MGKTVAETSPFCWRTRPGSCMLAGSILIFACRNRVGRVSYLPVHYLQHENLLDRRYPSWFPATTKLMKLRAAGFAAPGGSASEYISMKSSSGTTTQHRPDSGDHTCSHHRELRSCAAYSANRPPGVGRVALTDGYDAASGRYVFVDGLRLHPSIAASNCGIYLDAAAEAL